MHTAGPEGHDRPEILTVADAEQQLPSRRGVVGDVLVQAETGKGIVGQAEAHRRHRVGDLFGRLTDDPDAADFALVLNPLGGDLQHHRVSGKRGKVDRPEFLLTVDAKVVG